MADIKMPEKSGGLFGSKIFQVAKGFATGGPPGAALALVGANNKKAGSLIDLAQMAGGSSGGSTAAVDKNGLGSQFNGSENAPTLGILPEATKGPSLGVDTSLGDDPISRRLGMEDDPMAAIHDGIDALNHPDLHPDHRSMFAEPLLRAKHFGVGGGQ